VNGDLLGVSVSGDRLLAVYVGGVMMAVTMMACLLIVCPELMRAALDEAVTVAGLSRPAVITLMVAVYSIGWPVSLLVMVALVQGRRR
jgi:hypothetical protein